MVEFITGKNIKTACDKVLLVAKAADIVSALSEKEKVLVEAVKKQTPERYKRIRRCRIFF